jgi:hypothetical protein
MTTPLLEDYDNEDDKECDGNASVVFPSRREEEVVIAGERSSDVSNDCPTMTIEQSICCTASHTVSALATAISASSARVSGHDREDEATSGDSAPHVANSSTAGKQANTHNTFDPTQFRMQPPQTERNAQLVNIRYGLFWFKHRTTTEETRTHGHISHCPTHPHLITHRDSPCTQGQALTNASICKLDNDE